MEKLIYILIPVVIFLVKAYMNFVKEHQKTLNRKFGSAPAPNPAPAPVSSEPLVDHQHEAVELKPEKYLSAEEKEIKRKQQKAFADKKKVRDHYNPEIPSVEVIENRLIHEKHKHEFEFPSLANEARYEFDLRDAVIKDAIMRRPYE
mgnify:CR=1 FL=1